MQQINVKGIGLLNETQILNLVNNARKMRTENKVLREEIANFKAEVKVWVSTQKQPPTHLT